MTSIQQVDLQQYTKLPLKVVNVTGRTLPDIIIETPHDGENIIKLKKEHFPFLFGSVTQTDKHLGEIISQIRKIEEDSINYLIDQWIINKKK